MQEHPDSTGRALEQLLTLAEDRGVAVRSGTAAALRALAPLLGEEHVSLVAMISNTCSNACSAQLQQIQSLHMRSPVLCAMQSVYCN